MYTALLHLECLDYICLTSPFRTAWSDSAQVVNLSWPTPGAVEKQSWSDDLSATFAVIFDHSLRL